MFTHSTHAHGADWSGGAADSGTTTWIITNHSTIPYSAPYSTGRWVWDPYYGWTWVDDAPWGWAPYHYGRWVYLDGVWGWAPGPLYRPVYSPALVAFFGPGGGVGPLGWIALSWGEPIIPWWGPTWFVGRPCWVGWHGPHVVNNVVINNFNSFNQFNFNHANIYNRWTNNAVHSRIDNRVANRIDNRPGGRGGLTPGGRAELRDNARANIAQHRAGANDHYAGRNGEVFRRGPQGWQQHQNGRWSNAGAGEIPHLNREQIGRFHGERMEGFRGGMGGGRFGGGGFQGGGFHGGGFGGGGFRGGGGFHGGGFHGGFRR